MFAKIDSFVRKTQEYQDWKNFTTRMGFFLILGTTTLEMWGVWNQVATIYSPQTKSVAGVSITMKFLASIFYFAAFNRGVAERRLGLTIAAGCIALSYTPLLAGLLWVSELRFYEWVAVVTAVIAITLSFTDWGREKVFNLIATVIFFPLVTQPLEMFLKSTAAGLNPWDPFGFLVSCLAWVFYGHYTGDKKIAGFSALYATTYATTLGLWVHYH